jgi:hypothetical protein
MPARVPVCCWSHSVARSVALIPVLAAAGVLLVACKADLGESCAEGADCGAGLICAPWNGTCQPPSSILRRQMEADQRNAAKMKRELVDLQMELAEIQKQLLNTTDSEDVKRLRARRDAALRRLKGLSGRMLQ